jgi:hypothetical protein
MKEFNVKIKLGIEEKKLIPKMEKVFAKYIKGELMPELVTILKKSLFLKNTPKKTSFLYEFLKENAGLFTKLLLEDAKDLDPKSIVTYEQNAKNESIKLDAKVDNKLQKELINYPDDIILKKILKIDKNIADKKFDTAINKEDFGEE